MFDQIWITYLFYKKNPNWKSALQFFEQRSGRGTPQTSTMGSFSTIFIGWAVNYFDKLLHLRCLWGSWLRLWYKGTLVKELQIFPQFFVLSLPLAFSWLNVFLGYPSFAQKCLSILLLYLSNLTFYNSMNRQVFSKIQCYCVGCKSVRKSFKSFWHFFRNLMVKEQNFRNMFMKNSSFNYTAQKMKFSNKNFFSKCDQICRKLDLTAFTEEILNEKLHFLCSASTTNRYY